MFGVLSRCLGEDKCAGGGCEGKRPQLVDERERETRRDGLTDGKMSRSVKCVSLQHVHVCSLGGLGRRACVRASVSPLAGG